MKNVERTLVTGRSAMKAEGRTRLPVNDGCGMGKTLSALIQRKGALRVGTAAAIGHALVSRILAAHAAGGLHGSLSASRVLATVSETEVSLSIEGLTAASTRHATKAERRADIAAIGEILLMCLLGGDTSDGAASRAISVAPPRASALVALALEAREGRVESAEALSARLSAWEYEFDRPAHQAVAA